MLSRGRLEAFSDGVFAIVITLLVLELKVPPAGKELRHALVEEWPAYLDYLISCAFIGGAWIAHSTTTRFIRGVDAAWMRLTLLLLLFVSFLPFTTSLMSSHLNETDARAVTVLFGVNLTLATLMQSVLIGYSARTPGLAADDVAEAELAAFARERRLALALSRRRRCWPCSCRRWRPCSSSSSSSCRSCCSSNRSCGCRECRRALAWRRAVRATTGSTRAGPTRTGVGKDPD